MRNGNQIVANKTVILNLIQDLQRLPLLNNMRGRFQIKFGMTALCNTRAFTLIELLVVVLIIGILAAVAVPQYQKAVEKSRVAQALTLLKSVGQSAERYYLENGTYPSSFNQLDLQIPWTGHETWGTNQIKDTRSNEEWSLQIGYNDVENGFWDLWMGRLTGPYAGTGFLYTLTNPSTISPKRTILCVERLSHGLAFGGTPGDYCQKILNGTQVPISGLSYRPYKLP